MEKRILLEKRGREPNLIKELNLDNCRSNSIDGLTDEFSGLEKLSLINAGLTTLKNFPKLPSLKKLELSDNRISNALSNLLTSQNLTSLNLSGNKIKDFDELKPLASLEKLEILDLFNNEVTMAENYRGNVFKLLPSLKYLDGFDPAENEAPSDEDDEANGIDSEDDDEDAFCINGIDIDLKELDIIEQRIKEKKALTRGNAAASLVDGECSNDQIVDELNDSIEKKLKLTNADANDELKLERQSSSRPASMASIFLVIMSFFSILNQIYYRPTAKNEDEVALTDDPDDDNDELDDHDEDEEYEEGDGDGDVGLADVYNDDLEEDNSDYNEEGEEDEDVDEESDDDADETAEKIEGAEGEAESESPARGKKRKHDGEGEGEA